MKTTLACLCFLVLLFPACNTKDGESVRTSSSASALRQSTTVPIVTESYPPYSMEENGVITGISSDVVRAIFRTAKLQPEIRLLPWVRALETARSTPGTLIYSISRTKEREKHFIWIGTIAPYDVSLYALASRTDITARPIGKMTGLRVGLVQGTSVIPWFESEGFISGKNLDISNSYEANVRKLLAGRIDILPTNRLLMHHLLKALGATPDVVREVMHLPQVSSEGLWLAAHPLTDPALIARLKSALGRVRSSGEYLRIISR